jgi:hypothetical protein
MAKTGPNPKGVSNAGLDRGELSERVRALVARFDHSEGYKLLSLMRASLVVKRHWATA